MGEAQVLSKLTACASENGFSLTYTHKLFYICLMRYALKNGVMTEKGLRVCLSERDMSKTFSISPRMVTQSLHILSENGILLRQENTDEGSPKKPYCTYLLSEYLS